ncbi:2-amino-4-hydroxy-6-hydroxymethyldihydropteridine diphosphokinase [Photobacterium sp. 1_MG-2023]|uniref:2-amino-4-hydroxy-6- hydroxymethyldihydropteridine diphosphokinase n=1 Tax=Photobacterium sp. 1_MG-2023 TaxID=3062646 RepID=UPI0026E3987E|nr:2-amino-4-hydroxy-6-hydroxymethyldihydropteridine diphosphokinase [Photobacterium sp. 1_MG-2023]MDO6706487.1 2-amino-4-hydroxy-6-hydroxymethyldihydropteridine diphosphokinase [Photobacterium sp. 1_MG-2023]
MTRVFIAIGSNLNDPVSQARQAMAALHASPDVRVITESSLYSSTPMGPQDQPDYINAVVAIDTELAPLALLDLTQNIEQEHGRVRKAERWGPRTLDLDILLYGDLQHHCDRLTIPHYGMKVREFVLYPLAEIAPELVLPDGTALTTLLTEVDRNGLRVWQD